MKRIRDSKRCENGDCGRRYERRTGKSHQAWEEQRFCGRECAAAARRSNVVEEVAWIIDTDYPDSIAKRVGYASVDSLINKLHGLGEHELGNKLTAKVERYRKGAISYRDEVFA
jgi:hypothetical protein